MLFATRKIEETYALHFARCPFRDVKWLSSTLHSFIAVPTISDPCDLNPCGSNTRCNNGVCICLPEYQGDPYVGCRPECITNIDCAHNRACIRNKCLDPCPGTCGRNALCSVYNHVSVCTCPAGMAGNAFVQCSILEGIVNTVKSCAIKTLQLHYRDNDNRRFYFFNFLKFLKFFYSINDTI